MIERFMLNEELEDKVGDITGVDYSGMLKVEDIENIIKDLVTEYHNLEEQFENYKQEQRERENQEPFNPYEDYDINPNDFH